jgi:ubiquinone/menaquinone biosynthesis C-methylase UbiE
MKQWNEIFKKDGKVFTQIQEDMPKIVRLLEKQKAKSVLDLGCGSGRHLVYLAKNGFETYGFDIAEEGVKIANKWLKENNLSADFKTGSLFGKLPYKDNFFDAVISTQTINHGVIEDISKSIKEIERVLEPGGLIFVTVRKRNTRNWSEGKIVERYGKQSVNYKVIAPRTYVPMGGREKDLPHFLFNKEIIRKEFNHFKISDIWTDSKKQHYCFTGYLLKS